ncbi:hypothetical protein [Providencia sp. MGF014]|uniref:hypothetical protein n=1 Tax=Providencia sp. MGF014 TaxID=2565573 RepID=UPI001445803F|nr:hypothetical protein [Providencia sp. MGF014]
MSETAIVAVYPNEKSEVVEEMKNGFGSAPVIWNDLAVRYLGCSPYSYFNCIESVWGLVDRIDMPFHHRAVLAMTFDNCYIKKEHYGIAAECLQKYLVDFPPEPNTVNHWTRIYEILSLDPMYPAIGFWMTSVSENPFQGNWNEEIGDYDQPVWSKFWSVFDEFKPEIN